MERLDRNELLGWLEQAHRYFTFEPPEKDKQAYQQIKELILCEDMVQQYRDEKEADQAEVELILTTIILELLEQIERGKYASANQC